MKKLNKFLCATVAVISVFVVAAFISACKPEVPPEPDYTITLYLNGEQQWESFTGKKGSAIEFTKGDPVRANSNFKGWSLSLNGEVVSLPETMPEGDVSYYAVFTRYYGITLRAGAGVLTGDTQINAEVNQNLYSLVKDITPEAPGQSEFDGWYYGNKKLDANSDEVMPTGAITLNARYTIDYTINVYKQDGYQSENYDEVTADKVTKKGFIGSSPLDSDYPAYEGYELNDEKSGSTSDFVLSSDGGNIFNAYYSLRSCRLVFNSNAPSATTNVSGTMGTAEWGYNIENTVPECAFSITGYRFSHWSTSQDGSVRIEAGDTYKITDSTTVYAIWTKGYTDLYGKSSDYVYIVDDAQGNKVAYLERYYLDEIEGEYDATNKIFTFKEDGEAFLRGKIDEQSGTFAYVNSQSYSLHVLGDASEDLEGTVNTNTTMSLSDDGTAVYTVDGVPVNGTYAFDSAEQSMKFTAQDSSFYFRISQFLNDNGNSVDVFEIRSEKEIGDWCSLTLSNEIDANFVMTLNGYGEAVMHAVSGATSNTANDYTGYYRFAADSSEDKLQIYTFFITSGGYTAPRCLLIDRTETASGNDRYTKFYKMCEYVTTVYEKPAEGETLNVDTANKIALDGYGIFDDSAVFTKDGQPTSGKYVLNMYNYTLKFDPEGTESDVEYFIDVVTVGDNSYLVYEEKEAKTELNGGIYAITGLENNFVPGRVYGLRFFNGGVARLYVLMPDINEVFNTVNLVQVPIAEGTYERVEGSAGEYLFKADITAQQIYVISYYYTAIFQTALNISNFGDFRFKFTGVDDRGYQAGEVTALGDGYAGITVTSDGVEFTTDGYGKAVATVNEVKYERDYTVITTMGLPCLYLIWQETGTGDQQVTKQQMYTLIDGEYRAYIDEYGKYNTQYSSQIPDTTFRMVVYEGDYAVLAYNVISGYSSTIVMYSWGKVNWSDAEKKFGQYVEYENFNSAAAILIEQFGDFNFGLKEVTVQGSTSVTTAVRLFVYDASGAEITDGKFVINGENGATLTVDLNKAEAEYSVPDADAEDGKIVISGEFKFSEDVLTIVYSYIGADEQQYIGIRSFKFVYDAEKITSFKVVNGERGTWQDAMGINGNLYLTGEDDGTGKYLGKFRGYDYDTDSFIDIEGTYALTNNEEYPQEYEFTYMQEYEVTNEDGSKETQTREVSFRFIVGYSNSRLPVYRIYTQPASIALYGSISSTMPSLLLQGGGYSDLITTTASGSRIAGQLMVYPNFNLFINNAYLYAFANYNREVQYFFTIIGEGENARGVLLDGTFSDVNFGRFECEDEASLTIPVLKDDESGEYEDKTVNVAGIVFNGLGNAVVIADDDSTYLTMYIRYTSSTYLLAAYKDGSPVILGQFRLYTRTEEVPAEGEGEPETVTHYIIRFANTEMNQVFKGKGGTAFITDGFTAAAYTDANGEVHSCTFERLSDHPEVLRISYLNGFAVVSMYIEVDTENGTFTVLEDGDSRIPQESPEEPSESPADGE